MIIGNLSGAEPVRDACDHECAHCGKSGSELVFGMIRDAAVEAHWYLPNHRTVTERFRVQQIAGSQPCGITLNPVSDEPPVIPPPPPEVWLVYKHGGYWSEGGPLQGIYSSEEGAKDSVRFSVRDERRSLARRLGQPEIPHDDEQPPLRWKPVHHVRYGMIPGEFCTEAGLASYTVKSYQVFPGYLPDVTHSKITHITEES